MDRTKELETQKISKLIFAYSIPAITGMIISSVYNIIDRIFIGNCPELGKDGIAGITVAFPVIIVLMAIFFLFGQGGTILFSIKLGEKKREDAQEILSSIFIVLLTSGIISMTLGLVFTDPLLKIFGATGTVLPFARQYLQVFLLGSIFQSMSLGLNNLVRADGHPKIAMTTLMIGVAINIVLAPIFLYWFHWGMAGAALATILGQSASAVWIVLHFTGKRCSVPIDFKKIKITFKFLIMIASFGFPSFIIQVANGIMNLVLNVSLVKYGGDLAIAAMGTVNSIATLMIMPEVGIAQGIQPIVGYNYGARKYDRVKKTLAGGIIFATCVVLVGYIITRLFPEAMIKMFNSDPDLVKLGSHALVCWFIALPVVGFQIVGSNFFQTVGKAKTAILLSMTRQIIFLIPAILILGYLFGLDGIVYAAPFADISAALTTGGFLFFTLKNLKETVK
ncbi:MAG: MATE family efflux transporter [Bacillota bacterium]|nr:MATE family efflux transporter [Bacillota bacterium]